MNRKDYFDNINQDEREEAEKFAKRFAIRKLSSFQFPLSLRILGILGVVFGSGMLLSYANALYRMERVFHGVNEYMIFAELLLLGGIGIWVWGLMEVSSFREFLTENFDQMVADGIIQRRIFERKVDADGNVSDREVTNEFSSLHRETSSCEEMNGSDASDEPDDSAYLNELLRHKDSGLMKDAGEQSDHE